MRLLLGGALASLVQLPQIARIIVVDNASADNTCSYVRSHFPTVEVIENQTNLGFGCGNNVGLQRVTTPFALLVNPDAIIDARSVEALLDAAGDYPDAAILAPSLRDEDGTLHLSFKRHVFAREARSTRSAKLSDDEIAGPLCAEYLSGALMLWRMYHMQQIGFFDEAIFLYYEDDDICLRARAGGFSCVYVPQAKAMHLMGQSSGAPNPKAERFKQYHMIYSRLHLEQKYGSTDASLSLARKLRREYALRALFYRLSLNALKSARYAGRLHATRDWLGAATTNHTS